jgi:hypothetical protein
LFLWLTQEGRQLLPAPVLVAFGGLLLAEAERIRARSENKSRFHLDEAVAGFERAFHLLEDGNNSRVTWIAASRILANARRVAERVSLSEHRDILEMHMLRQRLAFSDLLGDDDRSPAFYFGAPDDKMSTDDAARWSTAPRAEWASTVNSIPESVLYEVWSFTRFPEEYQDPVQMETFPVEEVRRVLSQHRGLGEYLEHRARYVSIGGELHAIERNDA